MGIEMRFTDKDFPISPVMMEFLSARINGISQRSTWHDQISNDLHAQDSQQDLSWVESHVIGYSAIMRCYERFIALLSGDKRVLDEIHQQYKFTAIVGCPRHGGSYLTKQLFDSMGYHDVPNALAHDGFPECEPFNFEQGYNSLMTMMQTMAEYLTMVEMYFPPGSMVPKKATKAAYNGAFFDMALGPDTQYIITLRHPVRAFISTYEKSGGLTDRVDGRSNIECWINRDNDFYGHPRMDYWHAYLNYWESYHINLAMSGRWKNRQVVVFGKDRMETLAGSFFDDGLVTDRFVVTHETTDIWKRLDAERAIERVHAVWVRHGLEFPINQLLEAW